MNSLLNPRIPYSPSFLCTTLPESIRPLVVIVIELCRMSSVEPCDSKDSKLTRILTSFMEAYSVTNLDRVSLSNGRESHFFRKASISGLYQLASGIGTKGGSGRSDAFLISSRR